MTDKLRQILDNESQKVVEGGGSSFVFMHGVNTYLKNLWHDASEEPNGYNSIIIAYDNGCTVEPSLKDFKSYSEWPTIKKLYRVKKWCYLEDIVNEKE